MCSEGPDCINVTFEHVQRYSRVWRHVVIPTGIKESPILYNFITLTNTEYNIAFLYFSKQNITLFICFNRHHFNVESIFMVLQCSLCV